MDNISFHFATEFFLQSPKAPFFFPMPLDDPLILVFAKSFFSNKFGTTIIALNIQQRIL